MIGKILDYLWHITLPVLASTISAFATLTLLTKNSFLDEIKKGYPPSTAFRLAKNRFGGQLSSDREKKVLLEAVYYISVVILEIPTGYLADRIGPRRVLIAASVSQMIACVAFERREFT